MNCSTQDCGNTDDRLANAGGGEPTKLIDGGFFVTFEGPEGVGKSTQIRLLADALCGKGYAVCQTREPGGTVLGEEIRRLVKHMHGASSPCPEAELLLMGASRAQHVRHVILPALRKGKIVLCDRFVDSTTVYQGFARGLNIEFIEAMHHMTVAESWPDVTLILDMNVTDAIQRGQLRNASRKDLQKDRFDSEEASFHQRVRAGFLEIAELEPERIHVIDADGDEQLVHSRITEVVQSVLERIL